jgi:hypothetical protein
MYVLSHWQEEQFGWRVRQAWPSSICVIDTQDLHFIRRERMKALEQGALSHGGSSGVLEKC